MQNKAEDAGILTDSENDNAVMRNLTQQMLKDFIREIKYAQNHAVHKVRRDLSGFGQCYLVSLDFYKLLLHICINLVGHV